MTYRTTTDLVAALAAPVQAGRSHCAGRAGSAERAGWSLAEVLPRGRHQKAVAQFSDRLHNVMGNHGDAAEALRRVLTDKRRWRGASHASPTSLTLAGAEIREDHLRIARAMHLYTGRVLATPR